MDRIFAKNNEPYQVLKTIDAAKSFEEDPLNFLEVYGNVWFFCKCSPRKKQDCLKMAEN
jgi:hypothetical protein